MKSKISILILGCLLFFISACVSTKAVRLGKAEIRPPISADQVVVYRTADQVPGKYEEIALLTSTGESMWTSEEGMWKSMKKKAGKLGANAIILDAMSEPSAGAKVASVFLGVGGAQRKGNAIAIYVFPVEEKKKPTKELEGTQEEEKEPIEKKEELLVSFSKKIEVVIDKAKIRLEPNNESQIIGKIRFGTILQSTGKIGDWYTVNLPSSQEGVEISGYIHKFNVRLIDKED